MECPNAPQAPAGLLFSLANGEESAQQWPLMAVDGSKLGFRQMLSPNSPLAFDWTGQRQLGFGYLDFSCNPEPVIR